MSNPSQPVPVNVVPDARPAEVVIISHSPLFYWWPVWAVGFLMAAMTWWQDERIAFVPPGTVAAKGVWIEGKGKRDVLIAPEGQPLPAVSETNELQQPRMRMAQSNNPGILWALTLCFVVVVTHIQLRGAWSLIVAGALGFLAILFAVLGLWDGILWPLQIIDIHINALGYLSISLFLFVI